MNEQTFKASDLIDQFIKLRDKRDRIMEDAEKACAPYNDAMQAIEGMLTEQLNASGGESIKTAKGTAYRSTTLSARCADWALFCDFVFEARREEFLTKHVAKEAVKEYMDNNHGTPPPGVDVHWQHKTNIRRKS